MKKFKIWAIAGVMALFMAFSSANTVAVAEETADAKKGVVIEDEDWSTETVSDPIVLNNVTAKELIVESGNDSVLKINGGNIDTLSVVTPNLDSMGYTEIAKLLELGMPAEEVAQMYRNSLEEKVQANELRPTIKLAGDAVIDEMVVSAGATLNLASGEVKEVVVSNNKSEVFTITIQNYDGKVTVDQKKKADGTASQITVKLKNSSLSELEVAGQEDCSLFVEGDKASNVETVNVKNAASFTMMADAKNIVVDEKAEETAVRIYSNVENVVINADDCEFVVASSAKVQNATVDGNNVDVKYAGVIENVQINGNDSKASYATVTPVAKPTKAPKPTNEPQGVVLGKEDCTTGWWTAHSKTVKVEKGKTQKVTFWNYTSGNENWHNFIVVLQNVADVHSAAENANYAEYAVVRADNYGWGSGYEAAHPYSNWNWDTFRSDMNGAKVELKVKNNGATADIEAKITTKAGVEYYQNYYDIVTGGDLYFCLTTENGYLVIPEALKAPEVEAPEVDEPEVEEPGIPVGTVIGLEDCSTPAWTAYSPEVVVAEGKSAKVTFKNYTNGAANWNNFLVMLKDLAGGEYAVVRADNWGWGKGFDGIVNPESIWNWDTFTTDMNGATVEVTIVNNGTTADILANITTAAGKEYYQNYRGIVISNGELKYCLTVEGGYLVIE